MSENEEHMRLKVYGLVERARPEFPGILLAALVGGHYEFYGSDAATVAKIEGRVKSLAIGSKTVAAVILPADDCERWLSRLLAHGHKVAICDILHKSGKPESYEGR